MSFADTYFKRFHSLKPFIKEQVDKDLFLTIVIPAFNEPQLCKSLESLKKCNLPQKSVEVIVILNSSEIHTQEEINTNKITYSEAKQFAETENTAKIKFHVYNFENLPKKNAGVGLARKIGMDEAVRRFNILNKSDGLIAGFDADALVQKNYFTEIEKHFTNNPKTKACSINFEHPLFGEEFNEVIYENIINYELHLRYFIEALRFVKFPFAFHTIGSSFVVRADVYSMQGGMNRKKAGEDFYFLQKIIPLGNYSEINTTSVIPSPRISDRVPFGTGAAIKKMIEQQTSDFKTYDFEAFKILKTFFIEKDKIYKVFSPKDYHPVIAEFLKANNFNDDLLKIKNNSPDILIFRKRFFDWFNAFRLIKFLNFAHEEYFKKMPVKEEAEKLLKKKYPGSSIPDSELDMLKSYRRIQKNNGTYESSY